MAEPLRYRTIVAAGGQAFEVLETYDSIFERLQYDASLADVEGNPSMVKPLEVAVRGEDDRPRRCAIGVPAIVAFYELLDGEGAEVVE